MKEAKFLKHILYKLIAEAGRNQKQTRFKNQYGTRTAADVVIPNILNWLISMSDDLLETS